MGRNRNQASLCRLLLNYLSNWLVRGDSGGRDVAELFYRKLTGLPGGESPVVMVTTVAGEQGLRTVEVGGCLISPCQGRLGRKKLFFFWM